MKKHFRTLSLGLFAGLGLSFSSSAQVLWDNGPYFNSVGTGAGGANESVLYTTTFGMGTIGFGHQITAFNRVADDFIVSDCAWRLDSIVFFGYQTGSTTTSTFTAVNFRIWSGIPDQPGSTLIFGDSTTNRLSRTAWSGAYRITETTTGATTRPIMRNVCSIPGIILPSDTFWVDWASAGSLASGPWAPARTPVGVAITGNGRQKVGSTWNNALDGGTGTPAQGFPFIIYGTSLQTFADAGTDQGVCPGNSAVLGGAPSGSGGQGTLTYAWTPAASLNDSSLANPIASPSVTTTYFLAVTDTAGCMAYDTVTLTVGTINASFLPQDTMICAGSSVVLDAGVGTSYSWNTGDTTQTIFAFPGSYSVTVSDGLGCLSVDSVMVSYVPAVQILGPTSFCQGDSILLSTNWPTAFHNWSTGANTTAISVSSGGLFFVMVNDVNGCMDSASINVTMNPTPVANFFYSPGAAGLSFDFTDQSTGSPTSWAWDFGDGNTSTNPNPTHVYAADGSYPVTLIVSNACGSDTLSTNVTVVALSADLGGAHIEVAPNPATSLFTFSLAGSDLRDLTVEMVDLQGKTLKFWDFSQTGSRLEQVVNASELPRGIYLLRFRANGDEALRKVVLQ